MASAEVMAEFNPPNTSGASNSLFSKFGRSPSRKHQSRPSSDSIDPASAAAIKASKSRARPGGPHRGTTAPDGVVTLGSIRQSGNRKPSDGSSTLISPVEKSGAMFAVPSLTAAELSHDPAYKFVRSDVPKVPPIHGAVAYNPTIAASLANPNSLYQSIHDMSSKRMATLDYMRKA